MTRPAPLSHSSTHADFERRTRTGNLKWIDAKGDPIEFQMRFPDFLICYLWFWCEYVSVSGSPFEGVQHLFSFSFMAIAD